MPVSLIKPLPTTWLRMCSLHMPWKNLDLRNLLQNLILSTYALPSRNYFSETEIPGLYNKIRGNVVQPQLKEAKYFSSTTELWTSCANQPYLSLTVHFVEKKWALWSYCLDTTHYLKTTQTRIFLKQLKIRMHQNW